jgi:anti-sigma B factor antagonist
VQINVEKRGGVTILYLSGKMTIGKGDIVLRDTFASELDGGERNFVFEMSQLAYLDSAGVGETVACYKRASENGAIVKIVLPPKGKATEVFVVSCLDRVFEIFHDEDAALASFPN